MGGRALLQYNIETKRYTTDEYLKLYLIVKNKLSKYFDNVYSPRGYADKNSHGDLDVIVSNKKYDFNILKMLKTEFEFDACYHNGNVYSINYGILKKDFQVDIIFTKNKYFKTTCDYYDASDLGCLMGRIAIKLGVKYGHFGLKYQVMSEKRDKVLDNIMLSSDTKRNFEFLGFDYSKFEKGFSSLEDIFNYIINSKYFSKEIFAYENLNHENRTRNRKRDAYRKFLEYIEPKTFNESSNLTETEKLEKIIKAFPEVELEKKIFQLKENEKIMNQIKEKFNGRIIMKLFPELSGEILGTFIRDFKLSFKSNEEFNNFILNSVQEKINNAIETYYSKFEPHGTHYLTV